MLNVTCWDEVGAGALTLKAVTDATYVNDKTLFTVIHKTELIGIQGLRSTSSKDG